MTHVELPGRASRSMTTHTRTAPGRDACVAPGAPPYTANHANLLRLRVRFLATSLLSWADVMLASMSPEPAASTTTNEFASLVLPLQPALLARAMGLAKSPSDARDLVQDTLERALRNFDQFQPGARPRASVRFWLFRIMYNLFVDRYRRRQNELMSEPIDHLELPAPSTDAPTGWQALDDQQVSATMRQLDPAFRRVLELYFLDRRSYRDISVELGIPTGTVGTRLLRARQKLRAMLEEGAAAEAS
jgi:RNA polymerase sigma-70 factor (ECF subfamily)